MNRWICSSSCWVLMTASVVKWEQTDAKDSISSIESPLIWGGKLA
ncbi:MAG: hypothetical protein ACLUB2_06965 [Butyricicoccus pullicaecorum]